MRKVIELKERHVHSGEGCEFNFVTRVESSSISPTTLTNREFVWRFVIFLKCPLA